MSEPESQAFLLKALTLASLLAPGQRRPKPSRRVEMINTRPLTKGCVCREPAVLQTTEPHMGTPTLLQDAPGARIWVMVRRSLEFICSSSGASLGYHLKWTLPLRQGMACAGMLDPPKVTSLCLPYFLIFISVGSLL